MNIKSAGIISLLASGFVLGSSQFLPANAYGVTPTNAITLDQGDIGRTLDPITWLVPSGTGQLTQDLSAQTTITVVDLQANFIELSFNILNTTQSTLQDFNAAVVSLGLGIDQNVSNVSLVDAGETFDSTKVLASNQTFTEGFKGIDICAFSSTNCSGGDIKDGLQIGESDTFTLKISNTTGSFSSGVTIASYPVKFQSSQGSYTTAGVPEPITIIGSGLALGFGALLKKESAKKQSKDKVKV